MGIGERFKAADDKLALLLGLRAGGSKAEAEHSDQVTPELAWRSEPGRQSAGWRVRFAAAPLWVFFGYYSVVFGTAMFVLSGPGTARTGAGAVLSGLLFGATMTAVTAFRRDRDSILVGVRGTAGRILIVEAFHTGRPPVDPRFDAPLLGLAQRRRYQLMRARRVNGWLFGGFAALSLLTALDNPLELAYAAFFLVLLVTTRKSARTAQQRLLQLEEAISQRASVA